MKFYRYFLDGHPMYLVRYYWWAYLWGPAIWFFDHQVIINAILFGQYKKLMAATLSQLKDLSNGEILQLTCVYGSLTPNILSKVLPHCVHIADVSIEQLKKACSKTSDNTQLIPARMNAEHLAYKDNSFSTIVLFFLLHEMPLAARRNVLAECMRVLSLNGTLLCTEYAPMPVNHLLYRFYPTRAVLMRLEPFLASFWHDDLLAMLKEFGKSYGKDVVVESHKLVFFNFYRVTRFRVVDVEEKRG